MTTGRINQVTTLARDRQHCAVAAAFCSVTDQTRRKDSSRVVLLALPKLLSEPSSQKCGTPPRFRKTRRTGALLRFAFRLPNTRCEVGILKTVEFVNELHATDFRSFRDTFS